MSISLQKGQKVSLSKESKGLSNVLVGLGFYPCHLYAKRLQSLITA